MATTRAGRDHGQAAANPAAPRIPSCADGGPLASSTTSYYAGGRVTPAFNETDAAALRSAQLLLRRRNRADPGRPAPERTIAFAPLDDRSEQRLPAATARPLRHQSSDRRAGQRTTALLPSGRLCRDGVTRMHVFPAQEEIDLAVTRHNRRPIADLHHLRRGSYWRSATVMKRAGDRGELTPNPSCVRQWQMRPYLSAAQSRAAAASHLRWRSSRPSQQCVLLCRVARHAKSL